MTVKETRSNLPGPGPGRPKGVPNKATAELKAMILEALDNAGGVEYLERRANDPKTAVAFLTLVGKVLPLQVNGAGPNGEHVFSRIVREVVDVSQMEQIGLGSVEKLGLEPLKH